MVRGLMNDIGRLIRRGRMCRESWDEYVARIGNSAH